ncbi:hypothetical protein AKJ55_01990, partial [candidate division MSBL1 archaeon SCGC-AAA382M17]
YPLSGRGKLISLEKSQNGRKVRWGKTSFFLPDRLIDDLLNNYFKEDGKWYPLGASMTNPAKGGLGEYLAKNYKNFTPRHASAIAAIMVRDNLLEFRGKKPIELKKKEK